MKLIRECIKLKGMHDILPQIEAAKGRRAKTHSALAGTEQLTTPKINEKLVELELRKERQRFLRQDKSLKRSLDNVAKARSILLGKKLKNQRVMALRKELIASRYQGNGGEVSPKPAPRSGKQYKTIKLSY
ncbi:MAG: hypothetical protein A3G87_00085 [Omnitrophica bacterium RIFCSPLOWO2_12_FULL_50_11]|nr:MAG: hypothetical protein A3G87_00085 [Omnitrophica bacterium RIFCSPLOWO2_12_FULL_50_11]